MPSAVVSAQKLTSLNPVTDTFISFLYKKSLKENHYKVFFYSAGRYRLNFSTIHLHWQGQKQASAPGVRGVPVWYCDAYSELSVLPIMVHWEWQLMWFLSLRIISVWIKTLLKTLLKSARGFNACNARHMSHSFEYYMHGTLFRFSCKLPNFFQKQ